MFHFKRTSVVSIGNLVMVVMACVCVCVSNHWFNTDSQSIIISNNPKLSTFFIQISQYDFFYYPSILDLLSKAELQGWLLQCQRKIGKYFLFIKLFITNRCICWIFLQLFKLIQLYCLAQQFMHLFWNKMQSYDLV